MSVLINGQTFLSAVELLEELDISRQTLWRWRTEGRVPSGRRYRTGQVLFTPEEAERVKDHAHRVEPILTENCRRGSGS